MRYFALAVMMLAQFTIGSPQLFADSTSLRCGNELVSLGDTMYEVRRACGDPLYEKQIGERKTYRVYKQDRLKIEDITYVTEWVYERGKGDYILTFEGSRLVHKEYSR